MVVGNPIDHSLSPQLHNWIFNKLNLNAKYEKNHYEINELPEIINKIRTNKIDGINVTIPFKEKIINLLDEINPRVKLIGSVNCIIKNHNKIIGYNTDWYGFSQLLLNNNIDVYNKEVIIIGAGGVSKAVIFSLIQNGIKKIKIFNRTFSKAKAMENKFIYPYPLVSIKNHIKENSIIINCSSIGMKKNKMLISEKLISSDQIIIDTIYNPFQTKLLKVGENLGAKTINGMDMFIFQAIASLELWFGKTIFDNLNLDEIKNYLKEIL